MVSEKGGALARRLGVGDSDDPHRDQTAGVVLGASVPIVAPVRTDSMEVRMASCVLASLVAAAADSLPRSAPEAQGVSSAEMPY